jgi:hypothetical protein
MLRIHEEFLKVYELRYAAALVRVGLHFGTAFCPLQRVGLFHEVELQRVKNKNWWRRADFFLYFI